MIDDDRCVELLGTATCSIGRKLWKIQKLCHSQVYMLMFGVNNFNLRIETLLQTSITSQKSAKRIGRATTLTDNLRYDDPSIIIKYVLLF